MNSITSLSYASSSSSSSFAHAFYCFTSHGTAATTNKLSKFPQNSFSTKRRRSRISRRIRPTADAPPDVKRSSLLSIDSNTDDYQSLKLVLDVNQITYLTSSRFNHFVSLAKDAYYDLKTLISLDHNNRIVFSCRKSTIQFTGCVLLGGFVLISVIRVLINLGLGFRSWLFKVRSNTDSKNVVVRRDRSLGGKEVVVARRVEEEVRPKEVKRKRFGVLDSPFEKPGWVFGSGLERDDWRSYRIRSASKLPKWWPVSMAEKQELLAVDKQEYQRDANRLIRAITDYRTSGKDVTEHDIIQLRRICRTSGVQVSFDTTNTRDAFYRASVDYVLNVCSRDSSYSMSVQIDGEDAKKFVAGLAENIGLENTRAARMVSAAVAARTRSCFLQAWAFRNAWNVACSIKRAVFVVTDNNYPTKPVRFSGPCKSNLLLQALEVQGRHSEAAQELSKICLVLQTFPPEESSPEMEMVARGLGKNLKVEQRQLLMNMFVSVCSEESHRSAADALGLMFSPRAAGDEQESSKLR